MNRVRKIIHTDYAYKTGLSGKKCNRGDYGYRNCSACGFREQDPLFWDFCEGKTGLYDDNGHGTHVSGIVAGSGEASRKEYGMPVCHGIAPQGGYRDVKGAKDAKGNGNTRRCSGGNGVDCKEPAGISDPPVEYFRWNASSAGEREQQELLSAVDDLSGTGDHGCRGSRK